MSFVSHSVLNKIHLGRAFREKCVSESVNLTSPNCHLQKSLYFFNLYYACLWSSLVAQRLKSLPAMQETWVQSLDREDPLEKEMATHSSTLAWKILWMEEPGRLQSTGL